MAGAAGGHLHRLRGLPAGSFALERGVAFYGDRPRVGRSRLVARDRPLRCVERIRLELPVGGVGPCAPLLQA